MTNSKDDLERTAIAPTDWLPGYEVGAVIGAGGYGTVYRARQLRLDREVAVKVIDLTRLANSALTARFEAEAVILGRFHHPNIVQVFDYGYHDGRMYIAMELLDGEDLGQRLKRGAKLDERVVWAVARQCASALAHAAVHGIVHRDIKPTNLFLTPAPSGIGLARDVPLVKVTDFGLALDQQQIKNRQSGPGIIVGSPVYMAPEQYRGGDQVDRRADIYALGATLFHAIGGRPPFAGATVWDVMTHKLERSPDFWPEASRESVELIAEMMAPDVRDRIGSYEELLERIAELPATRDPQMPVPRRRKPHGRWRVMTAAFALLSAMSLALSGYLAFGGNRTPTPTQRFITSGDLESMFNNTTIAGWLPHGRGGNWQLERDEENLGVLAGTGLCRRPLPQADHYRVSIGLDVYKATAAEVHFAIPRDAADVGRRLVLRVAPSEGATVGARIGTTGPFQPLSATVPLAKPRGRPYVEVQFARAGDYWMVSYHGQEVGRLADDGAPKAAEMQFWVEGDTARVDTVVFQRLRPTP